MASPCHRRSQRSSSTAQCGSANSPKAAHIALCGRAGVQCSLETHALCAVGTHGPCEPADSFVAKYDCKHQQRLRPLSVTHESQAKAKAAEGHKAMQRHRQGDTAANRRSVHLPSYLRAYPVNAQVDCSEGHTDAGTCPATLALRACVCVLLRRGVCMCNCVRERVMRAVAGPQGKGRAGRGAPSCL